MKKNKILGHDVEAEDGEPMAKRRRTIKSAKRVGRVSKTKIRRAVKKVSKKRRR